MPGFSPREADCLFCDTIALPIRLPLDRSEYWR